MRNHHNKKSNHQKNKSKFKKSHPLIERARWLAFLMDNAFTIPFINKRIGLDPIISAVPVVGDLISAGAGLYIVWVAFALQLPTEVKLKMIVNVLLDLFVGFLPFLGDIGDAVIRSNQWNLELLERAYQDYHNVTVDAMMN
ncbi:MAG: DUF4112 domain-containing protein [Cyanobacteria bacterium P01_H01_bin.74]